MNVRVSYEALPNPGDFELVRADVERQLPLRNLHWVRKTGANRSIRTIQALPVHFKPLDYFGEQASLSLLARPYLHILFVVCDDNDTYRATIRAQIREWLDLIIARQQQEWLIVHVTSGKSAGAKFYQRKSAIVDKIKADFNVGKKDRCIQVAQAASAEDPTAWAEFTSKVKDSIVASFDANISLYEENVRKADSQRQLEGWQYLPFFAQKEALADSFEVMGLWEDALVQYDELEASFFQALKEHSMSWFGRFGGTSSGDDALPLLPTSNKAYRQMINKNDISVFDFRIYLFGRQAAMLFHLGRTAEIARRGAYFISTFARTLRQHQDELGENFCESWTYSACLDIVDECQRANERKPPERDANAQFIAAKAELLELARKQLDKLGMSAGHLPFEHPFAMSLQEISAIPSHNPHLDSPTSRPITRKDLLDAIDSRDIFDKLYVDLTNRTIRAYTTSGRKRSSLKLHCSLAALEVHRGRPDSAQKLYSHLPAHYVDLRWIKIEAALLNECTRLQASLEMSRERLLSTLALIRAGVEVDTSRWNLDVICEPSLKRSKEEDMTLLAKRLMDEVYRLSSKLAKDFAAIAFPTFSMSLTSDVGSIAETEDGVNVSLSILNLLPCPLQVDEVRLKFATPEGESIWFTAPACTLATGSTDVALFCPTAVTRPLALELSQIRFSRIIFQYSHRPASSRNLAPDPRNTSSLSKQPTVRFPYDHQALEVFIEMPEKLDMSGQRSVIICIAAGRNEVLKAQLRMMTDADALGIKETKALTSGVSMSWNDGAISLENLAAHSVTRLSTPISGQLSSSAMRVTLAVEYSTRRRPNTKRSFRRDEVVNLALPLAVNVQEFFRKECVMSKFSVSTDGTRALSIRSARLISSGSWKVVACSKQQDPLRVLPLQTSNFLFRVGNERNGLRNPDDVLHFELIYSTTEDELEARIRDAVQGAVDKHNLQKDARRFRQALVAEMQMSQHLVGHDLAFQLRKSAVRSGENSKDMALRVGEEQVKAQDVIDDALASLASSPQDIPTTAWRRLLIPVELPSLDVLSLVSVTAETKRTEVGRCIPVKIVICPTFAWSSREKSTLKDLPLEYDIVVKSDDWVLSGRKRGELKADDESEHVVELILVPLQAGMLFLPSVSIKPLGTQDISCETQHLNAASTIEVLPGQAATQSVFLLEPQYFHVN